MWDTKPTSFSASATYEVDAYVLISTGTAFIDNRPKPFGLRYAGWSPAQGKPRSRAMADLSWSWRSGPLSF